MYVRVLIYRGSGLFVSIFQFSNRGIGGFYTDSEWSVWYDSIHGEASNLVSWLHLSNEEKKLIELLINNINSGYMIVKSNSMTKDKVLLKMSSILSFASHRSNVKFQLNSIAVAAVLSTEVKSQ